MKLVARAIGSAAALTAATMLGGSGAPPSLQGCQLHTCDPKFVCIDSTGLKSVVDSAAACEGPEGGTLTAMPGPDWMPVPGYNTHVSVNGNTWTWTTSALDGPWLDFPGNWTYIINLPPPLGGTPILPPYAVLSADNEDAGVPHANFISGPGYLAEFSKVTPRQLTVTNASCAHYTLLIEVQADVSAAIAMDAGPGATDASPASTDAAAANPAVTDSGPSGTDGAPADAGPTE